MGQDAAIIAPPLAETAHLPRVTVLMATHDGRAHLPAQIGSIAAQGGVDWRLIASDDGSTDGTAAWLAALAEAWPQGRLTVMEGPGQGAAANFVSLILRAPEPAGHVAFCDQDDVWLPIRLRREMAALDGPAPAAALSQRMICTADMGAQAPEVLPLGHFGFANALVENLLPGNALCLNPAAFALARRAFTRSGAVSLHDWALYQLLTGAGVPISAGAVPAVRYRQHSANLVGAGGGAGWLAARLGRIGSGDYGRRLAQMWAFLVANAAELTPQNRALLGQARALAAPDLSTRIAALRQGGFKRVRPGDQAALWALVAAGRIPAAPS